MMERTYHVHWFTRDERGYEVVKAQDSNLARKKIQSVTKLIKFIKEIKK